MVQASRLLGQPGRLHHENPALILGQPLRLHCAVHDTGIGIPADKRESIFESFSQVDNSTTRRFGGTGLGLAVSAKLVQLMGGRIWVDSEVNRGSTFHFTAEFGAAAAETPSESAPVREFAASPVLILADHPRRRLVYEELLVRHGIRPTVVGDETMALAEMDVAALTGSPFRLAIVDSGTPGPNGWPSIDRIHAVGAGSGCAMIVMIPASRERVPVEYRHLPHTQFLTKPVKESELINAVRVVLDDNRQEPSLADTVAANVRRLQILLAEDGLINQEVAVGLLRMHGHHVEIANNGKEALAAFERQPFDVVLMDLEMPEMDGLEAAAAIRAKELTDGGHVPIIAMTAHAVKGFRERCLAAGMDDYITKPINPEELFRAVEAAVNYEAAGTA